MGNEVVTTLVTKDQSSAELTRFEGTVKNMGARISTSFASIGAAIAGALAVNRIVAFGRASVAAASEAADAEAKYVAMRKASNEATGVSIDRIKQLAAEMQLLTKFEDDNVVAASAMLLKYGNLKGEVFERTIKLAADMSSLFGNDLTASMNMVGRALNDPINASRLLKIAGVELTEEIQNQIKVFKHNHDEVGAQNIIFGELEKRFGGLSIAMGDTFSGRLAKLTNQFGDIKETIGGALIPAIERALPMLTEFADQFKAAMEAPVNSLNKKAPATASNGKTMWQNIWGGIMNFGLVADNEVMTGLFGGNADAGGGGWDSRKPRSLGGAIDNSSWSEYFQHLYGTASGQAAENVQTMQERMGIVAKINATRAGGYTEEAKPPEEFDYEKQFGSEGTAAEPFRVPKEMSEFEKLGEKWRKEATDAFVEEINSIIEEDDKRIEKAAEAREAMRGHEYDSFPVSGGSGKKDSFQAAIEGMTDVSRRISMVAGSREAPEEKIVKATQDAGQKVAEKIEAVEKKMGDSIDELKEMNRRLEPSTLGTGETGLA